MMMFINTTNDVAINPKFIAELRIVTFPVAKAKKGEKPAAPIHRLEAILSNGNVYGIQESTDRDSLVGVRSAFASFLNPQPVSLLNKVKVYIARLTKKKSK